MKEADLSKALEAVFRRVAALKKDLELLDVAVQVLISGEARGGPGSGAAVISIELEDLEAADPITEEDLHSPEGRQASE